MPGCWVVATALRVCGRLSVLCLNGMHQVDAHNQARSKDIMIPATIEPGSIEVESLISDWRFEMMETSWLGYWIFQLSAKAQKPLAMLVDLRQVEAFIAGVMECIEHARRKLPPPAPQGMTRLVAEGLRTESGDEGAIQVLADWTNTPTICLSFYRSRQVSGRTPVHQYLHADEALDYIGFFQKACEKLPNRRSWQPKAG
jgi:hypothetical protein